MTFISPLINLAQFLIHLNYQRFNFIQWISWVNPPCHKGHCETYVDVSKPYKLYTLFFYLYIIIYPWSILFKVLTISWQIALINVPTDLKYIFRDFVSDFPGFSKLQNTKLLSYFTTFDDILHNDSENSNYPKWYFSLKTRNQEIFGQKLADYAVDCLWIFSYSNAISRGKMTCIIWRISLVLLQLCWHFTYSDCVFQFLRYILKCKGRDQCIYKPFHPPPSLELARYLKMSGIEFKWWWAAAE